MEYYQGIKMQEKNLILSPPATPDLNDSNSNEYKVSGNFEYLKVTEKSNFLSIFLI